MADSVPEVAHLAINLADGCVKILEPLLRFLSRPSPRSTVVDLGVAILLLVLPTAYVGAVFLAYILIIILRDHNLAAPVPAPAPWLAMAMYFAGLVRSVVLLFMLVSAWLLPIALLLAAFYFFFDAGKRGISSVLSWNMLG